MNRRGTDDSARLNRRKTDSPSLKRRLTKPFSRDDESDEDSIQLHQWKYSVYGGLTWEKIKAYLEKKYPSEQYPKLDFKKKQRGDHWVFDVPDRMTPEHRQELQALRDEDEEDEQDGVVEQRRSVSPE